MHFMSVASQNPKLITIRPFQSILDIKQLLSTLNKQPYQILNLDIQKQTNLFGSVSWNKALFRTTINSVINL